MVFYIERGPESYINYNLTSMNYTRITRPRRVTCVVCHISTNSVLWSCMILIQRHALRKLRKPGISISFVNVESSQKIVRNLTNITLQRKARI